MKTLLKFATAVLVVSLTSPATLRAAGKGAPPSQPSARTAEEKEAAYARALEKRAQGILEVLALKDPAKAAKVHDAVIAQYRGLRDWHDAHDDRLKELGQQSRKAGGEQALAIEGQISRIKGSLRTLHDRFIARLSEQLTPGQVEKVKDQMTYHKVRVTYNAYREIVPNLTDREKARILELLREAREEAMDGGSAAEKSAIFKKYKGKIANYLNAQGHDVGKAYKEWGAKQKAKGGAKGGPPPT
jgi:hypothetical protein